MIPGTGAVAKTSQNEVVASETEKGMLGGEGVFLRGSFCEYYFGGTARRFLRVIGVHAACRVPFSARAGKSTYFHRRGSFLRNFEGYLAETKITANVDHFRCGGKIERD